MWRELDSNSFPPPQAKTYLCRLSYYKSDDDLFPIERNELFDINVYDSLFFISFLSRTWCLNSGGFGDGIDTDGIDADGIDADGIDADGIDADRVSDDGVDGDGAGQGQDRSNTESKNRCILLDNERANVGAAYQAAHRMW